MIDSAAPWLIPRAAETPRLGTTSSCESAKDGTALFQLCFAPLMCLGFFLSVNDQETDVSLHRRSRPHPSDGGEHRRQNNAKELRSLDDAIDDRKLMRQDATAGLSVTRTPSDKTK